MDNNSNDTCKHSQYHHASGKTLLVESLAKGQEFQPKYQAQVVQNERIASVRREKPEKVTKQSYHIYR